MEAFTAPSTNNPIESWFVLSNLQDLRDLPVPFRWEVTRRHPHYLRFWELARDHYQGVSTDPGRQGEELTAALIFAPSASAASRRRRVPRRTSWAPAR
jgi:hypothetical protein